MSVYKAIPQEDGDYLRSDGTRCELRCCRRHSGPEGVNVGWTAFESAEECLAAWGLTYDPASQGYAEAGPLPEPEAQPEN